MYKLYRDPRSNISNDNSDTITDVTTERQKRKYRKHKRSEDQSVKSKTCNVTDDLTIESDHSQSMWLPAISYTSPIQCCDDSVKLQQLDTNSSSLVSSLEDSLESSCCSTVGSTTVSNLGSGSNNSLRSLVDSASVSVQSFIDPDDTVTITGMTNAQHYSQYQRIPRLLAREQVVPYHRVSYTNSYKRDKMDRCRDQRQKQKIKDNEVHYPSIDKEDLDNTDDVQYSPSNKKANQSPQASPRNRTNRTNRIRLPPPKPIQKALIHSPPAPQFWSKPHPLPPVAQFQLLHKQHEPKRTGIFGQTNREGLAGSMRYTSRDSRSKRGQAKRNDSPGRDDEDNRNNAFLVPHFDEHDVDPRRKSVQYWQDLNSREQKLRPDRHYLPLLPDLKPTGFRRDHQRSTHVSIDYDSEQASSSVSTARSYKGSETYRIDGMDSALPEVNHNFRLPKLVAKKSLVMNVSTDDIAKDDSTDIEVRTKIKKRKKPRRKRKSKECMDTFGYNEADRNY